MPIGPAPRPTLTRRTLLVDLGRATLGAVALGVALGGCDGGTSSTADTSGSDSTASDTTGSDSTPAPADSASPTGVASESPTNVTWERASFGFVSAYVIVRDGEALVFDTGTGADGVEPLTMALEAAGVGWDDVSQVLVSHEHDDHIGGIDAVLELATGATTSAAAPDLATLQSRVPDAREVVDGDEVLGLRVVATPGHTPGHVAAFEPGAGILLAGDAIFLDEEVGGAGNPVVVPPAQFTADTQAAAASVGILADLDPSAILFGHGGTLTDDAGQRLSDLAARL